MNYFKGLDSQAKRAVGIACVAGIIVGAILVSYSASIYVIPCTS